MFVLLLFMIPWSAYCQPQVQTNRLPAPATVDSSQYGIIDTTFYQYLRRQNEINNAFILNNALLSESVNAKIQRDAIKHLEEAHRQHSALLQPTHPMLLQPPAFGAAAGAQSAFPTQPTVSNPNERLGFYDALSHLTPEQRQLVGIPSMGQPIVQSVSQQSAIQQSLPSQQSQQSSISRSVIQPNRSVAAGFASGQDVSSSQTPRDVVVPASSSVSSSSNIMPVISRSQNTVKLQQESSSPFPRPVFAGVAQFVPQQYDRKATIYQTTSTPRISTASILSSTTNDNTQTEEVLTPKKRIISAQAESEFVEAFEEDSQRVTPSMIRTSENPTTTTEEVIEENTTEFTTTESPMMADIFQHLNLSQSEARGLVERVEQIVREELAKKLAEKRLARGDKRPKANRLNMGRKHVDQRRIIHEVIEEKLQRNTTIDKDESLSRSIPTTVAVPAETTTTTTTTTTETPVARTYETTTLETTTSQIETKRAEQPAMPIEIASQSRLEEVESKEGFPIEVDELISLTQPASINSYDIIKEANKQPISRPKLKKIFITPNPTDSETVDIEVDKEKDGNEEEEESENFDEEDDDLLPLDIATGAPLNLSEADALETSTPTVYSSTTVTPQKPLIQQTSPFRPRKKMHVMTEFEQLANDYRQRLSNTGDINRLLRSLYENAYISLTEERDPPAKLRIIRKKPSSQSRPWPIIASSP